MDSVKNSQPADAAGQTAAGEGMRIAKFLAAAGIGPRRRCEELVAAGEIKVNGAVISEPGSKVVPGRDEVVFNGTVVSPQRKQYLLLNKPPGYTCSASDEHAEKLVGELFPDSAERLFTVGRLDRDSEGLLICTNDGEFAQIVGHPRHEVPKRYRVWVLGAVFAARLRRLEHGIRDQGDTLRALSVRIVKKTREDTELEFVIAEGRNREIRRMCRNCDWRVKRLRRVQIGPVKLGGLECGAWRPMTDDEREALVEFAARQG